MQEEKIIEIKKCRFCNTSFEITDKDLEFYDKVSPVFSGKKYSIPAPTLCPDCRQQKRLCFRNERKLYKRKCDATGKQIISIYSPDKPYKVYDQKEWWSDKWDAMKYGVDFDFGRGFFEQFDELMKKVPKMSLSIINSENSEFNNNLFYSNNSYLCFDSTYIENSSYISACKKIDNSFDIWWCDSVNQSLEIISSDNIYNCFFCYRCYFMKDCFLCRECYNCEYCIMCYGLMNKKYCIKNKQYSKEEYESLKQEYYSGSYKIFSQSNNDFYNFSMNYPHRNVYAYNSSNYSGSNIYNSNNNSNCFDIAGLNNGKFCYDSGDGTQDVYDGSYICEGIGMVLDSIDVQNSFKNTYSINISNSDNIVYSFFLIGCSNCFGCTGLRNKQYCILNKQYTKEQYEKLVPKIIEHMMKTLEWGEFFPSSISPFGYNETVAQEYFPINKEKAIKQGFNWSDYESPFPKVEKIIPASKLPDNIKDIPDDILNWAIECEITKKPFRIIKQELEFYRKHNLPIPRRHPDQRHLDRMSLRNPRKLFDRKCYKCGKEIKTTYPPERKEKVYCEECYNREVY